MQLHLGLIREQKSPTDRRVALTPSQCRRLKKRFPHLKISVETSDKRCFTDDEYRKAGIEVISDVGSADVLLGIKEVPVEKLVPEKTYLFFSHTKKAQPQNAKLLQTVLKKGIRLIDYECMLHRDGQRVLGFGFFAGIVGAHNGVWAYGKRTGAFSLGRVHEMKSFRQLVHTYFHLELPNVKIAVTGSGRVSQGILEIMNLLQIREVEAEDYLSREFEYPVYVHLKGSGLYARKDGGAYSRESFHKNPEAFRCVFDSYLSQTDVLMNGVYWEEGVPRLFESDDICQPDFRIQTIADVTDDAGGSVPINVGDASIAQPVYGIDRTTGLRTEPFLPGSIDVMAVGNLPNELPRDASRYFGEQLIKYVLPNLATGNEITEGATIAEGGRLRPGFTYLSEYAGAVT